MPLTHVSRQVAEKVKEAYPSLNALDLSSNALGCGIASGSLAGLTFFPKTIREVRLGSNGIVCDVAGCGAEGLWKALSTLPSLEVLDLSGNCVSGLPSGDILAYSIGSLQSLDLSLNPLQNLARILGSLSKGIPTLSKFSAVGTPVSLKDNYRTLVFQALPNLVSQDLANDEADDSSTPVIRPSLLSSNAASAGVSETKDEKDEGNEKMKKAQLDDKSKADPDTPGETAMIAEETNTAAAAAPLLIHSTLVRRSSAESIESAELRQTVEQLQRAHEERMENIIEAERSRRKLVDVENQELRGLLRKEHEAVNKLTAKVQQQSHMLRKRSAKQQDTQSAKRDERMIEAMKSREQKLLAELVAATDVAQSLRQALHVSEEREKVALARARGLERSIKSTNEELDALRSRENDVADRMRERMKAAVDMKENEERLKRNLEELTVRASMLERESQDANARAHAAEEKAQSSTFEAKASSHRAKVAENVAAMQESAMCKDLSNSEQYEALLRSWREKVFEVLVMHKSTESARRKMTAEAKTARAREMALKKRLGKSEERGKRQAADLKKIADIVGQFASAFGKGPLSVEGTLMRASRNLDEHHQRLALCERNMIRVHSRATALKKRAQKSLREASLASAKAEDAHSRLRLAAQECSALGEAAAKAEEVAEQQRAELEDAKTYFSKNKRELLSKHGKEMRDAIARSDSRYDTLRSDHASLQREHAKLNGALRASQGELARRKKREKNQKDSELADLKSMLAQKTQEVRNLRRERNALLRGNSLQRKREAASPQDIPADEKTTRESAPPPVPKREAVAALIPEMQPSDDEAGRCDDDQVTTREESGSFDSHEQCDADIPPNLGKSNEGDVAVLDELDDLVASLLRK